MMACLAGIVGFSVGGDQRAPWMLLVSAGAAYLAYMSMACTFLPLPTTGLILWVASTRPGMPGMDPWLVAAVGAVGTMIANLNDYHIISGMLRFRRVQRIRQNAFVHDAIKLFARAPFVTLMLFAFFPVPVDVVRLLAIEHGYSRVRFSLAYFLGRFPRYLLLAIWFEKWKPGIWEILGVVAFFGLLAGIKLLRDHVSRRKARRRPALPLRDAPAAPQKEGA
jgi:membrane protein YqaA with SNARE-associated domain